MEPDAETDERTTPRATGAVRTVPVPVVLGVVDPTAKYATAASPATAAAE